MSKSLSTIQTVFKVLKILCKVLFILCIVGAVGCAVGAICVCFVGVLPNEIIGLISDEAEISICAMVISCISGLVVCASEAVIFRFSEIYFTHVLEAGTPFTYEGSKEIFRLGVISIAVPLGVSILLGILLGISQVAFDGANSIDIDGSISIGGGLVLMFLSLIFKYGTELSQNGIDKENDLN